jgi:hypothetical protein
MQMINHRISINDKNITMLIIYANPSHFIGIHLQKLGDQMDQAPSEKWMSHPHVVAG